MYSKTGKKIFFYMFVTPPPKSILLISATGNAYFTSTLSFLQVPALSPPPQLCR